MEARKMDTYDGPILTYTWNRGKGRINLQLDRISWSPEMIKLISKTVRFADYVDEEHNADAYTDQIMASIARRMDGADEQLKKRMEKAILAINKDGGKNTMKKTTKTEKPCTMDTKVNEWYAAKHASDKTYAGKLNPDLTFRGLSEALPLGGGVYDVIGADDSIVRERLFEQLAALEGVDYDVVYYEWLNGGKKPEAPKAEPEKPVLKIEKPETESKPAESEQPPQLKGKGWEIVFDGALARTRVIFASKPALEVRAAVKEAGFWWNGTTKSWNRGLSKGAHKAALELAGVLGGLCA